MNTLYWIGRLEVINIISWIVMLPSVIGFLISLYQYYANKDRERWEDEFRIAKKWLNITIIAILICLPLAIFIPSKKEMYLIWGVGSTIDYIKENDTAKQLPDKAIQALDKWFDSLTEDEKSK